MSAVMREQDRLYTDWLPPLLEDYAAFCLDALNESPEAYPDATPYWKAAYAPGSNPPGSSPPKGSEPPRNLARIQRAYACLIDTEPGVALVRTHYQNVVRFKRAGEAFKAWEWFDMPRQKFYDLKGKGEAAIRGFLRSQ